MTNVDLCVISLGLNDCRNQAGRKLRQQMTIQMDSSTDRPRVVGVWSWTMEKELTGKDPKYGIMNNSTVCHGTPACQNSLNRAIPTMHFI